VKVPQSLKEQAQVTWKVAGELRAVHSEYNFKAPHETGAGTISGSRLRGNTVRLF
jgi:hypothetical protein